MNQIILGDNLEVLKKIESETVDMVYLDPPFFSNRNYEVIWGDEGEIRSFQDRWAGGIEHYIAWLKERVEQMHRVLKPTGSIFLHCDWHANAEIKVEILNKIFGYSNFRGEIIWKRHNAHNDAKKKIAVLTDTIWYYSKSKKCIYNPIYGKYDEKYIKKFYKHKDNKGCFALDNLAKPDNKGYRYEYKGYKPPSNGWRCPIETMTKWDREGLIHFPKNKKHRLRFKRYLNKNKGVLLGNIWTDVTNISSHSKERIGYPTQKPEKLLERIITMSTNENDLILDPFVGGGTTIIVAEQQKRKWIGIDQSVQAIKITDLRLQKDLNLFSQPYTVQLHKYDYDELRNKKAFEFETWIIEQFGGIPNKKQRGDFGIDGKTKENIPIQVKRSDSIGRNVIDNFKSAIERFDKTLYNKNIADKKTIGFIIAFSFGRGAIAEVARLKNKENIIIELIPVSKVVPIALKPKLTVIFNDLGADKKNLRIIEFIAQAESKSGIEFFAWDFKYNKEKGFNPLVLLDKKGKQTQKFRAGSHEIAVKVIDNEGLENIEIINLQINGKTKQTS
ncbi:MAG: hypothetical protein B6244_07945 [Candidatus Cloacimonetes bacterium 4572_55]|nr:MAG: hypothetical protein B6244_07945 [Candidatus Cloacimonetes bacterium 4572_55]